MNNDPIRLDRSKWEPCDKCKICLSGIKECYEVPHIRDSALTTSGSGDGHADPVGAPGTEGPSGAGPLNPLYKNDISNL